MVCTASGNTLRTLVFTCLTLAVLFFFQCQMNDPCSIAINARAPDLLRYNEVRQKDSHNSYEREESITDQLAKWHAGSLEFDIHDDGPGLIWPLTQKQPGDWYVYHSDPWFDPTNCTLLSDCLDYVKAWHDEQISLGLQHEVVTIWIDSKNTWPTDSSGNPDPLGDRSPAILDALVASHLGSQNIFTPGDLVARCSNPADQGPWKLPLQWSVTGGTDSCRWPRLSELRNKFILGMTGGDFNLHIYQNLSNPQADLGSMIFLAPAVSNVTGAENWDTPFFNLEYTGSNLPLAVLLSGIGWSVRLWQMDLICDWVAAWYSRAQHLATDEINTNTNPWATTYTPNTADPNFSPLSAPPPMNNCAP